MRPRIKYAWMGMYRTLSSGRHDWMKDADGAPLRRSVGPKFWLQEVFASDVARQRKLVRCVQLGEMFSLEIAERHWTDFVGELQTLARFVNDIDDENVRESWEDGRTIEQVTTYDAMIAAVIDFFAFAERYRGQNYTVSIAA